MNTHEVHMGSHYSEKLHVRLSDGPEIDIVEQTPKLSIKDSLKIFVSRNACL